MHTPKVQGQLTIEDYLAGVRLHMRPSRAASVVYVLMLAGAIFLSLAGVYMAFEGKPEYLVANPGLWGLVVFVLYRYVLIPQRLKRLFKEQKMAAAPTEMEPTEESLKITNEYGFSNVPWSAWYRWKEDDKLFLLYSSSAIFSVLPKKFFKDESQVAFVRGKLAANVVPPKKKPWLFIVITVVVLWAVLCMLVYRLGAMGSY
jgi:hypothetical protein